MNVEHMITSYTYTRCDQYNSVYCRMHVKYRNLQKFSSSSRLEIVPNMMIHNNIDVGDEVNRALHGQNQAKLNKYSF